MIKTTFAAIAALLLSVAASAQTVGAWSTLEGQHSRIAERRTVAVADKASWEKVWSEHSAGTPAPAVNFNEENVVAVFLGETKAAGVKIEIVVQNDMIDANRLNVFYKEVRSAAKPFAAQMVCRPFAMVKVRKAATVSFEVNGRVSIPENMKAPKNPRDDSKVRALLETLPSFDGR
ncbi:MAG: hypothetical protein NDJ72_13440 [Elusimicrobia bacterium]|nr:hypothetical protein [Elusimicrobiota bacterium]